MGEFLLAILVGLICSNKCQTATVSVSDTMLAKEISFLLGELEDALILRG